ncbi:MAG TPA: DUF1570 domain-containing protein, partial [Gemmataceae bacterium]
MHAAAPRSPRLVWAFLLFAASPAAAGRGAAVAPEWEFDVVRLKNGAEVAGLIVRESPAGIEFQIVRRKPGRPTVVVATHFRRSEVAGVRRLSAEQRQRLKERLAELDPTGKSERARMEEIEFEPAEWGGEPKAALRYVSDYFTLTSNAPEAVVRRAAVRLEQVYAAYLRFLPPRHPGGSPTSVLLVDSREEYQKLLRRDGREFLNPAFYEPSANRIVCLSDLRKLGRDVEEVRRKHARLWAELADQERELRRLFAGSPADLARYLQPLRETRLRIVRATRANDAILDRAAERLFALLYHEAFHAYLANFVYPAGAGEGASMPRWLDEGLAQIFETALVEAGELRVGHADRRRLEKARELLRDGGLVPVRDLLRCGPGAFRVVHLNDRAAADRTYVTCWALAFYLTFERRLLGTEAMDAFVRSEAPPADAPAAFEQLVGQPLERFEADFHA